MLGSKWTRVAVGLMAATAMVLAACAPAPPPAEPPPAKPAEPAPAPPKPDPGLPTPEPGEELAETVAGLTLTETERAEVDSFYQGRTLRIIVGFGAGGGYDVFARLAARHLGRNLPGNPTVIVENMPGAASVTAANHVFNAAPKDGTVIATFRGSMVLEYAMDPDLETFEFDPADYPWLGSPNSLTNMCMVTVESGADTIENLLNTEQEIVFGATSPAAMATSSTPSILSHYFDAPIRVVHGYDGTAAIKLAVERGELDGTCGTWEAFRASHAEWLEGDPPFARVVLKAKDDADGQLQDVPLLSDHLPSDEARQIHALALEPDAAGYVYAAPPEMPAERLTALRMALYQTWTDSEFMAEAEQADLGPAPQDYRAVQQVLMDVLEAPTDLLERAKEVLGV